MSETNPVAYQSINYMAGVGIVTRISTLSSYEIHDFMFSLTGYGGIRYNYLNLGARSARGTVGVYCPHIFPTGISV